MEGVKELKAYKSWTASRHGNSQDTARKGSFFHTVILGSFVSASTLERCSSYLKTSA